MRKHSIFLPYCAVLYCVVLAFTGCGRERGQQKTKLPNIVILYADDMGYGDMSCQNPDSKIPTPNIDRLAGEGVRFTDAHSSSGICTPSRYALLTGRHHWRKFHGIVNSFDAPVIDSARLTLAEMLRASGYSTACIGKWHLGWHWPILRPPSQTLVQGNRVRKYYAAGDIDWSKPIPGGPLDHGFDYYFGDDVPNFPPYTWIENDRVLVVPTLPLTETPETAEGRWEARPGPMAEGWRLDAVMPTLTEKAVEWLDRQADADKPFFLYFPFTSPHAPIVPVEPFLGQSGAGGYGDFMVQTDWSVGQVLQALDRNGFSDNTLVIFTSDNGPERYAYERVRRFNHRSMGPLRGLKRDIWEGGHRVPCIIRWPGVVRAGCVSDVLISQVDIMPTLADLLSVQLGAGDAEDGYSLMPLLSDQDCGIPVRSFTVQNTFEDHYAIRTETWSFIDAPSGRVSPVPGWYDSLMGYEENPYPGALYDLEKDIGQKDNLYATFPQFVDSLKARLRTIRSTGYGK